MSVVNIFTSDETFVKNNLTFLSDSGTIQQSNSDKESYFLNNERKALINQKKAFEDHKQQGNLLCEPQKKTVSYAGSLQCRRFLRARECFARESTMLKLEKRGANGSTLRVTIFILSCLPLS